MLLSSFASAAQPLVKPKVTAKATPKSDLKGPRIFRVKGTVAPTAKVLSCAAGVTNLAYCSPASAAQVCKGSVRITIKRGLTTIARKSVKLTSACSYNAKITVRKKMKHGKLTITSRFLGNGLVSARNSSAQKVKV
jgi:hypothetical protein